MVRVKGLSKKFRDVEAVRKLSFHVNQGEVYGLLGENGAGKTTTLRMMATMLRPTEGTVDYGGIDLLANPEEVRRSIGILFGGDVGLYDRLTARENIAYFAQLNDMKNEEMDKRIRELSDMLDMGEYLDRRVGKFSRGMKQKVSIARALVHDPGIMLLDEPTSGLDVSSSRIVQDFILDCKTKGKTVIMSSHIMSEVEKLCHRIGILHKGELVAEGTVAELKERFGNDNLEEVFLGLVGGRHEA